jgi:TATA-binding protein-associated factor
VCPVSLIAILLIAVRLGDVDDDVRTVAASALMPIAPQMATRLPQDQLAKVVHALWDCLKEGGDELGSSTGAVMDLLGEQLGGGLDTTEEESGEMISHPEIIAIMAEDPIDSEELGRFVKPTQITPSGSRSALISRIYAFVRHPISSVRLAVIKALLLFASTTSDCIDRDDWMRTDHLSLLLQNLMLEERSDIREISLTAFSKELEYLEEGCDLLYAGGFIGDFLRKSVEDWYDMVMTPIGSPLQTKVVIGTSAMGHNVDKPMLAGDMSLISTSMILNTRIAAAKALSGIRLHMEQGGGVSQSISGSG